MKKHISLLLTVVLLLALLAGCAGTPVIYYSDCTCPEGGHAVPDTPDTPDVPDTTAGAVAEGAVKTGLYVGTNITGSAAATAEANGKADYDVTIVAVTVDDKGVITSCVIDSLGTSVNFDTAGLPVDFGASKEVQTKNELGDNYGMVAYGNAKYEWYQQAAALADYAVGKTVEELRSGAVGEDGKAVDADLASTASIRLGGYVDGIEAAVASAVHLGAQAGDELKLASVNKLEASAIQEAGGGAVLNCDVAALTVKDGVITSCVIDAVQAKVEFNGDGTLATDLAAPVQTKGQLGEAYGMKAFGNAKYEWNEQAAAFAAYVTGKTAAEVAGIAVDESTKPTEADLSSSVTIAVGGFQGLIAKAMQ